MAASSIGSYGDLDQYYLHALHDSEDAGGLTIFLRGSGVSLEDAQNRKYLDGLSGLWNVHLGYGREELVAAATEQMRRLPYSTTYSGFGNAPAMQLAARLEGLAYQNLKATFFTASGADANEAAFKTARFYWRRKGKPEKVKIISLEHGYHGVTLAAMSASGISSYGKMFQPVVPHFLQVKAPYPYRCDFAKPGESPGIAAARLLEEAILREGPETVAAFIAEPVQGAGGVVIPPGDYFPEVRRVCDRHGVLARVLGDYLLGRLKSLLNMECVGEIRGLGLMAAVELVGDRATKRPFDPAMKIGDQVRARAQQAGLLIRNRGDVIHIAPPFIVSEQEVDKLVLILSHAIADATRGAA
jgi:adenosylmethionine-8-amino-7-oxononanoate aminotransferase